MKKVIIKNNNKVENNASWEVVKVFNTDFVAESEKSALLKFVVENIECYTWISKKLIRNPYKEGYNTIDGRLNVSINLKGDYTLFNKEKKERTVKGENLFRLLNEFREDLNVKSKTELEEEDDLDLF